MQDQEKERIIDDDGKIKFCRMKFDFELLESVVQYIKGFDYKKCKENPKMIRYATDSEKY